MKTEVKATRRRPRTRAATATRTTRDIKVKGTRNEEVGDENEEEES